MGPTFAGCCLGLFGASACTAPRAVVLLFGMLRGRVSGWVDEFQGGRVCVWSFVWHTSVVKYSTTVLLLQQSVLCTSAVLRVVFFILSAMTCCHRSAQLIITFLTPSRPRDSDLKNDKVWCYQSSTSIVCPAVQVHQLAAVLYAV